MRNVKVSFIIVVVTMATIMVNTILGVGSMRTPPDWVKNVKVRFIIGVVTMATITK